MSRRVCELSRQGPWVHENGSVRDVRAWATRGWCRVEQLANALAPCPKPIIVAQSPHCIELHTPTGLHGRNFLLNPVGTAAFTVESDRTALGPVIAALVNTRKARSPPLRLVTNPGSSRPRPLSQASPTLVVGITIHLGLTTNPGTHRRTPLPKAT
jgi:hypothetical protein